ncbi:Lipase [Citrus sinensis]|uniref:Lipase n=1 Tax=Citrus sinensis TaxID=2711 RepID=A0ACB8N6J9_CITSI|nr:Lipase [Citrus sinensis]
MKVVLTSTCVVILLCGSAFGTRIELFQAEGRNGMAASPTDGLCETMVKPQDYACEEHQVMTKDGYIISVQRIPVGRSGGAPGDRPPVLLQHGLLGDGSSWVLLPPDQALAFVLADNEFDVWLANTRGTTYSLGHSSLSPQDKIFTWFSLVYWNWSWDELVSDELPAMFQYVYNETGQKRHYVGHSQGSLIALGALSNQQPLNMWKSAALLAPVSYLNQISSNLVRLAADNMIANVSYWLDLAKFDPLGAPAITLIAEICVKQGIDCRDLMSAFSGKDCSLKSSGASVLSSHKPQSSATKNLIHFNKKHYGQPTPPVYNMTSIPKDFPLFLCHGGADSLSDVKDVKLLINSLKNHVRDRLELHFIDKYAHVDFILGVNAKKVVYDPLIAFFKLQ